MLWLPQEPFQDRYFSATLLQLLFEMPRVQVTTASFTLPFSLLVSIMTVSAPDFALRAAQVMPSTLCCSYAAITSDYCYRLAYSSPPARHSLA